MGRIVLFGLIPFFLGVSIYVFGFGLWLLTISNIQVTSIPSRYFLFDVANYLFLAFALTFIIDLGIVGRINKTERQIRYDSIKGKKMSIVMTAYNDEDIIEDAVKDFKTLKPDEIIVIDNNNTDNTSEIAKRAGAKIVIEYRQGYGYACMRGLKSAKSEIIILVEGDQTFKAYDAKKLLAYLENVDMVVGTRITQELLAQKSQLNWFLTWGNIFIAKLLQLRFWGETRFTDVGCTYRAIRKDALNKIINQLHVGGNDFAPHMAAVALKNKLKIIEVPITFRERGGVSKGVGSSYIKGFINGINMIWHIFVD